MLQSFCNRNNRDFLLQFMRHLTRSTVAAPLNLLAEKDRADRAGEHHDTAASFYTLTHVRTSITTFRLQKTVHIRPILSNGHASTESMSQT